jgi:hypothetical protein
MESHYETLNKKLDKLQDNPRSKKNRQHCHPTPAPRTVNLTHIEFTTEEMTLLNQGLQYCIQKSTSSCITNLAMETERAIRLLDPKEQHSFRINVTQKLKEILHANRNSIAQKRQNHLTKQLNSKILINNALITKADKGKTLVIMYKRTMTTKSTTSLKRMTSKSSTMTPPKYTITPSEKHSSIATLY